MKRLVTFAAMMLMISTVAMAAKPKFSVKHVEPLSWWVGMNTPLQLMINGEAISEYEVDILPAGQGVAISAVHRADSPNYIFVDVSIAADAKAGVYQLQFSNGRKKYKYDYTIAERVEGSRERKSFTTADFVYLIIGGYGVQSRGLCPGHGRAGHCRQG